MKIINIAELKGRLITYFGGVGVSVSGAKTQKAIEQANESNVVDILYWSLIPGVSLGSALTILGALIVISRFAFDVWTYFDKRKLEAKKCSQ